MKNTWKKYAAIAMAGVLSAGMLSGCGDKKEVFDGTKTVATINGEEIPMGVFSFVVRNQQAYLKALYESYGLGSYLAGMYDSPAEEGSDMTYGEQTKYQMLEQVETMYLMKNKAAEYGVEITAEEEAKLAAAAEAFIASNSEETIKTLGVTADDVKTYLELNTYYSRMRQPIYDGADHEVSDEEAQMSSFRFVHIRVEEPEAEEPVEDAVEAAEEVVEDAAEAAEEVVEEASEAAEETVEEAAETAEEAVEDAAEETAEETEAEPVEDEESEEEEPKELTEAELKAQDLAATLFEALSESKDEDLEEVAKAVDESIIVARGTFQTNVTEDGEDATPSYLNEDMIAAVRELKEGEITPIIETEDDGYYVAWLENAYDESATQSRRDSIISEREDAFYNETVDEWLAAAEISINDEVLSTLKVTDSMVFTMTSSAFDTEEIPEDELVEDELMEDGELADDEMVPVEGDELVEETAEEAPVEEAAEEEAEEAEVAE